MWGMPFLTSMALVVGLITILIAIIWELIPDHDENEKNQEDNQ